MTIQAETKFNVGGLLLDRPFKVRRLGHFGFYVSDLEKSKTFYNDLLGFKIADGMPGRAYFLRHGTDHHSGALFLRPDAAAANAPRPGVTIQQISWQIQTLEEMVTAVDWLKEQDIYQTNVGRGGPGANWHTYPQDPDGHRNELYYGMEQIGWQGYSRPKEMYRGFSEKPTLPQIGEEVEVENGLAHEIDLLSGHHDGRLLPDKFDVDGIMLARPFKITRHGPMNIFVEDPDAALKFYCDGLGFRTTESVTWSGETCHFLRCNTEHHSVGIYPVALRGKLGLTPTTTCAGLGIQLANYRQLRAAVEFLRENGVRVETDLVPPELNPGIDYSAYAFDPDGNPLLLYYYMEQVGWDGNPRPAAWRRSVEKWPWPQALEPLSDSYGGDPFLGPIG